MSRSRSNRPVVITASQCSDFPAAWFESAWATKTRLGVSIVGTAIFALCSASASAATSGRAWKEFNGTAGYQAAGDFALAGATVRAYGPSGVLLGSTTTAADGTYTLSTPDGNNQVVFEIPGHVKSIPGASNSTSEVQFVNDPVGPTDTTANFQVSDPSRLFGTPTDTNFTDSDDTNLRVSFIQMSQGDLSTEPIVLTIPFDAENSATTGTAAVISTLDTEATIGDTGMVYGLAYHRSSNRLLAGAYFKRHAEVGPSLAPGGYTNSQTSSLGQIYLINRDVGPTTTVSLFADINDINNNTTATGAAPRAANQANWDYYYDAPTTGTVAERNAIAQDLYRSVGRTGLGDVELSDDQRILYTVGLRDRRLYQLDASVLFQNANPAPRTSFLNPSVAIPTAACANSDDAQPFALAYHEGALYVGVTCTAASTTTNTGNTRGDLSQLRAAVYRFNPGTQTFDTTPVLNVPLNYPRGCTEGGATNQTRVPTCTTPNDKRAFWQPWNNNWQIQYFDPSLASNVGNLSRSQFFIEYPMPLLVDIDFDRENFMTLGYRDIGADRAGTCTNGPDVSDVTSPATTTCSTATPPSGDFAVSAVLGVGDLMCAAPNGSVWSYEADGACGTRSANNSPMGSAENDQGPDGSDADTVGGEFFWNDQGPGGETTLSDGSRDPGVTIGHGETISGSLAILPFGAYGGRTVEVVGGSDLTSQTVDRWVVAGMSDPTVFYDAGIAWFDPVNGQSHKRSKTQVTTPTGTGQPLLPPGTGKGSGLGDIELISPPAATTVVGNRVWREAGNQDNFQGADITNSNGVSADDEPGVSDVDIVLYNAGGIQIGRTTTAAGGFYNFTFQVGASDANASDATVILPNPHAVNYFAVIDPAEFLAGGTLAGESIIPANAVSTTPVAADDLRDSDAMPLSVPTIGAREAVIQFTLTAPGANDFSLDFGVARVDRGDLPDSGVGVSAGNYETLSVNGGPSNDVVSTLRLGDSVGISGYDSDIDGQQSINADGDNTNRDNDENGLTPIPPLRQGSSPTVTLSVFNNTGATRNRCGYLDFNNNGVFDTPGEVVETTVSSSAVPQNLPFAFTGSISASQIFANNNLYGRFRVQEAACSANGYGGAGEVEDYAFPVSEVGVTVSAIPDFCPGQSVVFTITLSNAAGRATATNFPVTADLVGTDEGNLAGIPSFADANWAVTSTTGGATLATSAGNGVDINTTATIPAGGEIVITVQATVANGVSLARTVAVDVRPAAGSVDALASNDDASGSSTLGSCGTPPAGGGALCPVTTGLSALSVNTVNTVVNGYWAGAAAVTPGATVGRCVRVASVAPAAGASDAIAAGDLLLLVQMQGATIEEGGASYGDGVAGSPGGATAATAGRHEFVIAQGPVQATGGPGPCAGQTNVIEISGAGAAGGVINSYAHDPNPASGVPSSFQVVRVQRRTDVTFIGSGSISAPAWNGSVGGVIVLDATGEVNLGASASELRFDANSDGFRGATCSALDDFTASPTFATSDPHINALKGEGYAGTGANPNVRGLGAPGSAGGGGQRCAADQVTGGGGGGNGTAGGAGGADTCTATGHGGGVLPTNDVSRLTVGGGGGAGANNNDAGSCTGRVGGAGGGLIVVRANAITGQGTISATGQAGQTTPTDANAGYGGGAGGTVVLLTNLAGGTTYSNTTVNVSGGAGSGAAVSSGGGGGGGAGRIFLSQTAAALAGTRTLSGGAGGTSGAGAGSAGGTATGGTAVTGLDPVNSSPGVKPGFVCDNSSTVPVTIAQVESRNLGSELEVSFVTASEAGTLGYHVYADGEAGRTRLNGELVLSTSTRGLEKQQYVVRGPQLGASSVTIEEVDVTGKSTFYGPYPLNRSVGESEFTQTTDWGAIRAEQSAWRTARIANLRSQGGSTVAELGVSSDGWYRVTGAELQSAGVDLNGVPVAELGLFVGSSPVAMQVEGGSTVSPTTALSFYGRAVADSLYTTRQVYRLQRQAGPRLTEPAVATGAGSVTRYVHVERQAPNVLYSFSSPLADPWYASRIVRQGSNAPTASFTVPVSAVESGPAEVSVTLYGGTDLPESDDHHAVLKINGQAVASAVFDGFTARTLRATVDASLLTASTLVEVGFGPTPYSVDLLHVESVELRYPRRLELLDGELRMAAAIATGGDALLKSGFETNDGGCANCSATEYVVNGVNPGQPVQVLRLEPTGAVSKVGYTRDGSSIRFATAGGEGVELLVTQRIRSAGVEAGRAVPADLLSGSAKLLVIGHASFIESPQSELNRLLQARQAEGLSTKVVDVQDLYRAYSGGVTDARAIAAYVRDAVTALGTRYVLLVGGDTYDYGNHLNLGSVSFVPTLYTATSPFIRFAPADGLLADLDGDRRANVAVGRLPVRTVAELNRMVDRILSPASGTTAVLVSDREQAGYRYSEQNAQVAAGLPANWTQTHLKLDDVAQGQAATVRQQLAAALGQGQSLLSWYGHSSPSTWSREGVLTAPQVYGGVFTHTRPTTVIQWGCWGAYFVDPRYNTLAHAFLLNASGGAATFVGATALTETVSDTALGERLKPLLAEPVRIGDALLEATLALPPGVYDDVTVGTVILGDPSARLRR